MQGYRDIHNEANRTVQSYG
eukprot:Gb_30117 [translate_table: standard]